MFQFTLKKARVKAIYLPFVGNRSSFNFRSFSTPRKLKAIVTKEL